MFTKKVCFVSFSILLVLALVWAQIIPAFAAAGDIKRVSVDSNGMQSNGWSDLPAISTNGRFIVFESYADNLVSGDTNGAGDIFMHDTVTNTTTRVSVNSSGMEGNYESFNPSISADGRYVAFASAANNLVIGDTYLLFDVFVRDTLLNTTKRVSVSSDGFQGNADSDYPAISADGRYVAFISGSNTLVSGDSNGYGIRDVFVHDTLLNTTVLVSVDSNGVQGNASSGDPFFQYDGPSISADGRYIAFTSYASNLVSGDTNEIGDIFVRDTVTNITKRVSVASNGAQAESGGAGGALVGSFNPFISADGRYVVFVSYAYNLVDEDTNGKKDIFVHDMMTNTTKRISLDSSDTQANGHSDNPSISANGQYIVFTSNASNLVGGDTNNMWDIFVRDTVTNTTSGIPADFSLNPFISGDGHYLTFVSTSDNLVGGDTNGEWNADVFVYEIPPPPIFADLPINYWAWSYIERLYNDGITGGCTASPLNYCPEDSVTRAQMAVFLEKGLHYPLAYTAPNVAPTFTDTVGHWAEDWIEALKSDGVTAGCATGLYCPENPVTRAQMAVFLLKSKYGSGYLPPAVGSDTGFGDVPTTHWAAAWIKQLAAEGITGGCGGGNYCPENSVTRAQMAVFLVKTFNLP